MIFNPRFLITIVCIFSGNVSAQNITVREQLIIEIHHSEMVDPGVTISNDMNRIGFRIRKGDQQAIVIDGVEVPAYHTVRQLIFSRASKQVAYLATKTGQRLSLVALKKFCAERLPLYMVPDTFTFVPALPKTSTDKVDYQRLKEIP